MSLNPFFYSAGAACDAVAGMRVTCYHLFLSKKDHLCPMFLYVMMLMVGLMVCHWGNPTVASMELSVRAVLPRRRGRDVLLAPSRLQGAWAETVAMV